MGGRRKKRILGAFKSSLLEILSERREGDGRREEGDDDDGNNRLSDGTLYWGLVGADNAFSSHPI